MFTLVIRNSRLALPLFALAGLAAATAAYALDGFDPMSPMAYTDLVRQGKVEYAGKRYDAAFPLLTQGACAGDKESQWTLGQMYLLGQGVQRNDVTGYSWLSAAAEFRPSPYSTAFAKIEASIDPKELPALQSHAEAFVEKYGLAATRMSCRQSASRGGHVLDRVTCEPDRNGSTVLIHRCVDSDAAVAAKTSP